MGGPESELRMLTPAPRSSQTADGVVVGITAAGTEICTDAEAVTASGAECGKSDAAKEQSHPLSAWEMADALLDSQQLAGASMGFEAWASMPAQHGIAHVGAAHSEAIALTGSCATMNAIAVSNGSQCFLPRMFVLTSRVNFGSRLWL